MSRPAKFNSIFRDAQILLRALLTRNGLIGITILPTFSIYRLVGFSEWLAREVPAVGPLLNHSVTNYALAMLAGGVAGGMIVHAFSNEYRKAALPELVPIQTLRDAAAEAGWDFRSANTSHIDDFVNVIQQSGLDGKLTLWGRQGELSPILGDGLKDQAAAWT